MATITIVDTGYPNIASSGTVATSANIANSGSAITFKCTSMRYTRGGNLDDSPVPAKYTDMELNFGSVENPIVEISGILSRKSDTDMNLISDFDLLVITKGIKCLYYNNTTDGYRDLTDDLGSDNANDGYTNHPTEPHLHGRIKKFIITQGAGSSHCIYRLMFQLTS